MTARNKITELPETKRKLVNAGVGLMRAKGFNATTVDDICAEAGVTKGAFFHYFESKNDIAKAAVQSFRDGKSEEFAAANFRKLADPLARVYGRLDFVKESAGSGNRLTKGCLVGMLAQELSFTHPELRNLCQEAFSRIAREFETDLTEAKAIYAPTADFDAKNLAQLYVSIFQGSTMMAKAAEDNAVLVNNIEQFRRYLNFLFDRTRLPSAANSPRVLAVSRK
jgi:TetR/AcrR family transcriptional repressor of nem operon